MTPLTVPAARRFRADVADAPAAAIGARSWAVVLGLALALRAGWAVAVPALPVSDSVAYDTFARNLAFHGTYGWEPGAASAYWPVGTSFLYSLLYRVFGPGYAPIVVLNVALGLGIVALTMLLARRWFGRDVAVVAGLLVACWPSLVEFTTVLASELPFIVLVLGAAAVWLGERRTSGGAVWAGVLLAGACYIRPTALLLPAVLALLSLAHGERPIHAAARTAIVVATMAALIAPWSIRNTLLFDRFVLISTNGGTNTWMGNNAGTTGLYMELPPLEHLDEAERDAYLAAEARRYILQEPARFAGRTAVKLVRLHERESIGIAWNVRGLQSRFGDSAVLGLKLLGNAYWWAMLALAIGAVGVLGRRSGWAVLVHPAIVTWAYFSAVHAVTIAQDRYHFPSNPFIAMLAAVSLAAAMRRGRGAPERAA